MTLSPFYFWIAVAMVVAMPYIIWANYQAREGIMAHLWREDPTLVRATLTFLSLLVLFAASELLAYYDLLSRQTYDVVSMVLGLGMLILSLSVLYLGTRAAFRYMGDKP
jgi:hypothetical protein